MRHRAWTEAADALGCRLVTPSGKSADSQRKVSRAAQMERRGAQSVSPFSFAKAIPGRKKMLADANASRL
jgi:hypothetical protein